MVVSWVSRCQRFGGFIGFTVSWVPWFHRLRGVKGFMHGFLGFIVPWVSWFHRFLGVNGSIDFVVSRVSFFHRLRGGKGFMGLVVSMVS